MNLSVYNLCIDQEKVTVISKTWDDDRRKGEGRVYLESFIPHHPPVKKISNIRTLSFGESR